MAGGIHYGDVFGDLQSGCIGDGGLDDGLSLAGGDSMALGGCAAEIVCVVDGLCHGWEEERKEREDGEEGSKEMHDVRCV